MSTKISTRSAGQVLLVTSIQMPMIDFQTLLANIILHFSTPFFILELSCIEVASISYLPVQKQPYSLPNLLASES